MCVYGKIIDAGKKFRKNTMNSIHNPHTSSGQTKRHHSFWTLFAQQNNGNYETRQYIHTNLYAISDTSNSNVIRSSLFPSIIAGVIQMNREKNIAEAHRRKSQIIQRPKLLFDSPSHLEQNHLFTDDRLYIQVPNQFYSFSKVNLNWSRA